MNPKLVKIIASQLNLSEKQVENTIELLEEGATIPFISRYRKEKTGSLDETQILQIQKENKRLTELEERRFTIIETIEGQGNLTEELEKQLLEASSMSELEDLYLPYKPKRKTKGVVARERGLEPLAKIIMAQREADIYLRAEQFIGDDVPSVEDALQGARDIIAEWVNENIRVRSKLRHRFETRSIISSSLVRGKDEEGQKYQDYFDYH